MTVQERRCVHCGIRYSHQRSGEGCGNPLNDSYYCPDCKAVILKALETVPRAVEKIPQPVTDEKEQAAVLSHRDSLAEGWKAGKPRRVGFPLFDYEINETTGTMQYRATQNSQPVAVDNCEYTIRTWSDNREPETVEKWMEHNLITDVTVPWRDIR